MTICLTKTDMAARGYHITCEDGITLTPSEAAMAFRALLAMDDPPIRYEPLIDRLSAYLSEKRIGE